MVGANQRAERAAADRQAREPVRGSLLLWFLTGLWAWGLMSPQMVQKIAERCLADLDYAMQSESHMLSIRKDLESLATIGNSGRYSNNCQRDLRLLCGF